MNENQPKILEYIVECPQCRTECVASYLVTEGLPVMKLVQGLSSSPHWIRTECCCCWSDEKKTVHYSFMAEIPYDGDGEVEFRNSVPKGECNEHSKENQHEKRESN